MNFTHYDVLPQICKALKEAGAEEQVFFETNFPPNSADMLDYKGFSEIYACLRSDTRNEFLRIMQKLCSASHVTSVQLGVSSHAVDDSLVSAVADYIRSTLTLQKLHLILYCDPAFLVPRNGFLKAIILSLAQNASVKELHMKVPEMENEEIDLLARTVKSLQNIQRMYFVPERARDANRFFSVLSEDIASNYTLLSLTVDVSVDEVQAARDWFLVWDTTRRNSGLLNRAALFVSGTRCDRPCGEAVEWMCRHPALPQRVVELASVNEAQAAAKVRDAVKALEDMNQYMRLTGVVSRCVVCLPSRDGSAQLDDLNEDCWRVIRRYLLLADVRIP
ncbi:hypothetical protein V5799_031644 [Amblyomma americanum]|uniref:Uncharacterized protein n=1 Tax=Amblyomma americanum TaxID=6943 RepID=A0AAQ4DTF7_AMBAM